MHAGIRAAVIVATLPVLAVARAQSGSSTNAGPSSATAVAIDRLAAGLEFKAYRDSIAKKIKVKIVNPPTEASTTPEE